VQVLEQQVYASWLSSVSVRDNSLKTKKNIHIAWSTRNWLRQALHMASVKTSIAVKVVGTMEIFNPVKRNERS
jgi:hypothetical protein